jgi:hypothetical protein
LLSLARRRLGQAEERQASAARRSKQIALLVVAAAFAFF